MTNPPSSPAYNELVEVIVKAVPDIMEIKHGCLLKPKVGKCTFMVLAQTKDHVQVLNTFAMEYEHIGPDGNPIQWVWKDKGANKAIVTFAERFEILGRPITLEDVLRALKESKREWIYAIDCYGNLLEYNPEEGWEVEVHEYNLFKWHLGKPLSEQSQETITFLHSLLKL